MAITLTATLAARLMMVIYYFGFAFGVLTFGYRKDVSVPAHHLLLAPSQTIFASSSRFANAPRVTVVIVDYKWYTWFCVALRLVCACGFYYGSLMMWYTADPFYNYLTLITNTITLLGSIGIVVMQLWMRARCVTVTNAFQRLLQRTQRLTPNKCLMQAPHLLFLTILVVGLLYDAVGDVFTIFEYADWREAAVFIAHIYLDAGLVATLHVTAIGYLCIGALYKNMNVFMRENLYPRARRLDFVLKRSYNYRSRRYVLKLLRLTNELEECAYIYRSIYCVGQAFHRTLRVLVFITVLFYFSVFTNICYATLYRYKFYSIFEWDSLLYTTDILADIFCLALGAYSAVHGAELSKNLSLDNVYMRDDVEWNRVVELLISRSNFYDFKLNLFGLFDLTNEVILMFLSGVVTFLTFIIQNSIRY